MKKRIEFEDPYIFFLFINKNLFVFSRIEYFSVVVVIVDYIVYMKCQK